MSEKNHPPSRGKQGAESSYNWVCRSAEYVKKKHFPALHNTRHKVEKEPLVMKRILIALLLVLIGMSGRAWSVVTLEAVPGTQFATVGRHHSG